MEDDFTSSEKLKIACFICNWAFPEEEFPTSRKTKVFQVNFVRMACIGGIDPTTMLDIFMKGIDGVLLIGCAPPDCHFIDGNIYADLTVNVVKKLLSLASLEPERLELNWISPMEEVKLTKIMREFSSKLRKLGHSPLSSEKYDANILENVLAAKNAVADFRLRALIGKENELIRKVNVYGEKIPQEEFNILLDEVVRSEFIRQKILLFTRKKPSSVKELANTLNIKPAIVLRHILNMRRKGAVTLETVDGTTPLYKAMEVR